VCPCQVKGVGNQAHAGTQPWVQHTQEWSLGRCCYWGQMNGVADATRSVSCSYSLVRTAPRLVARQVKRHSSVRHRTVQDWHLQQPLGPSSTLKKATKTSCMSARKIQHKYDSKL
jgi:hypothetical protein